MGLYTEINQLKNVENPQSGVLSIYLSTKPGERDKWRTQLKNGFKQVEKELEQEGNAQKIKAFEELREKVENELKNCENRLLRSIVIFAEGGDGLFEVHFLQLDVENDFAYGDKARVEQLEQLSEKFPKTGIIVAQMEVITIHNASLGEIEDSVTFELDLETDDWRRYQGRSARGNASSSSQVDQFDSRKENQIRKFYKEVSNEATKLGKENDWSNLVAIGHQRSIKLLEDELALTPDRTVSKNLGGASEEEVLNAAFPN